MGKVIILTGAPDASKLDWMALEPTTDSGPAKPWRMDVDNSGIEENAPQWRVIPSHVPGEGQLLRPKQDIERVEFIEHTQTTNSNHQELYGRAEFLALTPATQGSTQGSTQNWTQQASSIAPSSLDEASLSLRLPNALPPQQSQSRLPPLPLLPPTTSFVTSQEQEFLEYSLAVHDALPSSLPVFDLPPVYETAETTTASFDETTMSLSESVSLSFTSAPLPPMPADIPRWQPLTQVADVPSAAYLLSVAPQTVTVNLVVAIVSVGLPRTVGGSTNINTKNNNKSSRRDRPPASLVELVVGDETRSGFGLTIWMDGAQAGGGTSSLASLLPTLAPHDVVLLRHVALHVFGDKVYGSSLRKDQTKMHILYRGNKSGHQRRELTDDAVFSSAHLAAAAHLATTETQPTPRQGDLQLLAKTARVRNWALRYVIVGGVGVGGAHNNGDDSPGDGQESGPRPQVQPAWMMPPADTQ